MSSVVEYSKQAELALAAYADLPTGVPDISALRDQERGMSPTQAARFAEEWRVIEQYTDAVSGLSVTVFAPMNDTDARYLAFRGTEPAANDLTADGLLALGLPALLNPQYVALKARIDRWLADPAMLGGRSFSVAGHSD